jgi:hypothetical protein
MDKVQLEIDIRIITDLVGMGREAWYNAPASFEICLEAGCNFNPDA